MSDGSERVTALGRRSCLSVPGSSSRKLEKAAALAADEFVLDLEDAVAAAEKADARRGVVDFLAGGGLNGRGVAVRVNALGSPWFEEDVRALGALARRPFSLVVPKVEGTAEIDVVAGLLGEAEADDRGEPIRVQALVETAAGVARAGAIATASERLDALIIGYADLAASLGRSPALARDPDSWLAVQDAVLIAARAAGCQAIDGPWLGVEVDEGFTRAARRAAELGFDGKWAIHPAQIDALNALFTPDEAEVDRAERVLAALDEAARAGAGAAALDGEMIDEALAVGARRILAKAQGSRA
ncbi:MAG: CoA ester lyase [Actinobacteria bacterium]|nr:CoA ester lyase [Actinomycetota bacterium]